MMIFREELLKRWWVADPFRPTEEALQYYEIKHDIIRRLQPRSICEIGVRAGYSLYAFMSAAPPGAEYLGIDWGTAGPGTDIHEASSCDVNAAAILKEFEGFGRIMWKDSQRLRALPTTSADKQFELVHVDGDHTFKGCAHDLELAAVAKWILVDDFDVGPEVRGACREFLLRRADEWEALYIPDGFRGNLLLVRKPCHWG